MGGKGEIVMKRFQRLALALVATMLLIGGLPQRSDAAVFVGIGINVGVAPPALPIYSQPPAPYPNAIWQPGYWAYGQNGYYWVGGRWVAAPQVGYLWTPGYWGFNAGYYNWHPGYWGPHIGFYGGINYGFGYYGHGYVGGAWYGGSFRYNTAVTNVNTRVIHNVYVDRTVVVNHYNSGTRYSYNGGGGVRAYPSATERTYRSQTQYRPQSQYRPPTQYHPQSAYHPQSGERPAARPRPSGRPR
jgi:WXXGXW repeat (2 copies)